MGNGPREQKTEGAMSYDQVLGVALSFPQCPVDCRQSSVLSTVGGDHTSGREYQETRLTGSLLGGRLILRPVEDEFCGVSLEYPLTSPLRA